jgi:hypothetical protein
MLLFFNDFSSFFLFGDGMEVKLKNWKKRFFLLSFVWDLGLKEEEIK